MHFIILSDKMFQMQVIKQSESCPSIKHACLRWKSAMQRAEMLSITLINPLHHSHCQTHRSYLVCDHIQLNDAARPSSGLLTDDVEHLTHQFLHTHKHTPVGQPGGIDSINHKDYYHYYYYCSTEATHRFQGRIKAGFRDIRANLRGSASTLTEVSGSDSSSSSFLASTTAWQSRRFFPSDATKQALAELQYVPNRDRKRETTINKY